MTFRAWRACSAAASLSAPAAAALLRSRSSCALLLSLRTDRIVRLACKELRSISFRPWYLWILMGSECVNREGVQARP